jgi:flagellar hook-basal body complex protein FliE
MIAPILAAKAYATVQAQAASALSGGEAAGAASGPSFGDILKNSMNDAVQSSRDAETKMIAHTQGKADLVDVVTAISSAQASLQTVLAVRDQVISAYQQVMQMQI